MIRDCSCYEDINYLTFLVTISLKEFFAKRYFRMMLVFVLSIVYLFGMCVILEGSVYVTISALLAISVFTGLYTGSISKDSAAGLW